MCDVFGGGRATHYDIAEFEGSIGIRNMHRQRREKGNGGKKATEGKRQQREKGNGGKKARSHCVEAGGEGADQQTLATQTDFPEIQASCTGDQEEWI